MKKIIIIAVCFVVIAAIVVSVILIKGAGKSDLKKLTEKYTEYLVNSVTPKDTDYAIGHSDQGDYFEDIDYTDDSISSWTLLNHLYRLNLMTLTAVDKVETDEAFRGQMIRLVDYWINNDFQNSNWWYNDIGVPQTLAKSIFILKPYLTEQQLDKIEKILLRGSMKGNENIVDWTGANLTWGIFDTVNHALLFEDEEYIQKAVERASTEIEIKDGETEGIKKDYSFYQHGPQNYIFGYGRDYMNDVATLMYLFSDTKYMFAQDKIENFEGLLLEGAKNLQFKGYCDYQTLGRDFARQGYMYVSKLASAVKCMLDTKECIRKDEMKAFLDELEGKSVQPSVKSFPVSYMAVSRTENSYMSCKGVHTDYLCSEAGGNENVLAYNFFDGATLCFMREGTEYDNLSPIMDFSLIPGVTAFDDNDDSLYEKLAAYDGAFAGSKGQTDICSVSANDKVSCIGMQIRREFGTLNGYTSRIFGEGCAVIAGSDIYSLNADANVRTCINQTVYLGGDLKPGESKNLKKGESITMGGFVYTNLCDIDLCVKVETVKGDWKRNNRGMQGETAVTGDVVKIYYDHGELPDDVSYAVAVREVEASKTIKLAAETESEKHTLTIGENKVVFDYSQGECNIQF